MGIYRTLGKAALYTHPDSIMKAVSFLGLGSYRETTYVWNSQACRTSLFPVALCRFFVPAELLVLVTQGARERWLPTLLQDMADCPSRVVPVDIPDGHSVDDLWEIFACMTEHLREGDEVLFDITHSFRTLPLLAFLAASYLRVARNVQLRGVYYGAYEAREPRSEPSLPTDQAPVFDLTPFVSLLEWTAATDLFLKTGSARDLAVLLPEGPAPARELAQGLDRIAHGLHLLRPTEVMRESAMLPERLRAASAIVAEQAPPFAGLLHRLEAGYGAFGVAEPLAQPREALQAQLRMIRWYRDRGQIVHALSLAREWLPSLLCHHFGLDPLDGKSRRDMEVLLAGGTVKSGTKVMEQSAFVERWNEVPSGDRLRRLWCGGEANLANLRNDVLHASFRRNPKAPAAIEALTDRILEEIQAIASEWGLNSPSP